MTRIFLLSTLILYLEMLLIRWIGTEIRVFAYLQNGVLVAAFLGLGLGLRDARGRARLLPTGLGLTLIGIVIRDPWHWGLADAITQGLTAFQDSVIWSSGWRISPADMQTLRTALVTYALVGTLAVLWAVVLTFRPLGQWLGRWMDAERAPIAAYTANILGSLAGIVLFTTATALRSPPVFWLALAGAALAATVGAAEDAPLARVAAALLCLALPLYAMAPSPGTVVWSPYQKLVAQPGVGRLPDGRMVSCGDAIVVNGTFYQGIVDLDAAHHRAAPDLYPPGAIRSSHYVLPYEVMGARSVHAVEIDPDIVRFGRERHPNHPYASDKVRVTVDDARALFRRDQGVYDVVWLGFLDSHTTPSAYTNVRLDHFVYTRESFADVKRRLAPGGVVVLYFLPDTPWIGDRLARILTETFGTVPVSFSVKPRGCLGHGGLLLIGGGETALASVRQRAESDPEIAPSLLPSSLWPLTTMVTTDDWPYLYLERPSLPTYFVLVGLASLALAALLRRRLFQPGDPVEPSMVLLGAGFMLLEVSGVSRAALLYGTTWMVNAYVVGAMLAMTLLANWIASARRVDASGWPFGGLVLSLLMLILLPPAWLGALPPTLRIVGGGAFLAVPVFFSGLIFVTEWARLPRKDLALGSNILGALLGGIASMLSLLVGFRALAAMTLAVYLGARLALGKRPSLVPPP